MTNPLVFISHKHADSSIAAAVADFITARSLGRVDVYTPSNRNFSGPRFGARLNSELRQALWRTEVFILVYTSADQDWSFCMWEYGLATHPQNSNTRVIVFQCGPDAPTPFASDVRVDVRNFDNVLRFTKEFLTNPTFFPSLDGAIAPAYPQAAVEEAAHELFAKIREALPPNRQVEQSEADAAEPEAKRTFVCYAREDSQFVLDIAAELKAGGANVWLDQWDIPSGADWDNQIDEALYGCRHFLIVLSPAAVKSEEVRSELSIALDERKRIVPVLYQSCRVPRRLRLLQHIDFTAKGSGRDAALQKILRALTR